jgi:hypothetical protein
MPSSDANIESINSSQIRCKYSTVRLARKLISRMQTRSGLTLEYQVFATLVQCQGPGSLCGRFCFSAQYRCTSCKTPTPYSLKLLHILDLIWISPAKSYRYNTAVFSTLSANAYNVVAVDTDFFEPSPLLPPQPADSFDGDYNIFVGMHELFMNGTLHNYTNTQCMQAYGTDYVSKVSNVLLVTTNTSFTAISNSSAILYYTWYGASTPAGGAADEVPFSWLCGDFGYNKNPYTSIPQSGVCKASIAIANEPNWTLRGVNPSYCMVQEVVGNCQLSFSLRIMVVVIIANAAKACISMYPSQHSFFSSDLSYSLWEDKIEYLIFLSDVGSYI